MIRVCPERDAVCPHGLSCPFVGDRYACKPGWRTPPSGAEAVKPMDLHEPERPDEPCVCGAQAVLYDVNLEPLCRACADACKYAPDEAEALH